ncbi:MAG: hypothetical protein RI947_420 [Candidatus Parcubacteria bacterium]|jgi:aminotransferase
MKPLNKNVLNTQLSAIKEILMLAAKTEGIVSLAWGLPLYELDETVKADMIKAVSSVAGINKYAPFPGLPALRTTLVENLNREYKHNLSVDNVLITNGAIEALFIICMTLLNAGDEVIIPSPFFSGQMEQVSLMGARVVNVPLHEDTGWSLDIEELRNAITDKTKAILITSPNNPTGSVYDKKVFDELVAIAHEHDIFIISDETYNFLSYGERAYSLLEYRIEPHFITVRSFSKQYAMTGMRVGYVLADISLMHNIMKAHDASVAAVTTISQYAALAAADHFPQATAETYLKEFREKRQLVMDELTKYSDVLSFTEPAGAFYIMPKYHLDMKSMDLARELVDNAKVAVVPGSGFGEAGEYHLRLSFAGKNEDIVEGVKRIGEYLRKVGKDAETSSV